MRSSNNCIGHTFRAVGGGDHACVAPGLPVGARSEAAPRVEKGGGRCHTQAGTEVCVLFSVMASIPPSPPIAVPCKFAWGIIRNG